MAQKNYIEQHGFKQERIVIFLDGHLKKKYKWQVKFQISTKNTNLEQASLWN
jgi:hypothetical protein